MEKQQLERLELIADSDESDRLPWPECEALQVALAERAEAIEHVSTLASLLELDPNYTTDLDLYEAGEVAKLFVTRAKGGSA